MEVGAILEAHKRDQPITHSLCIMRVDETAAFQILSPCGICQERLRHWGPQVQVAVTHADSHLRFEALDRLQPLHWSAAYRD